MEKARLTHNNIKEFNLSKRLKTRATFFKSVKNSKIINHYKLIKNIGKESAEKLKRRETSNSVILNKDKIEKKYKFLFNSPGRRIQSTKISPKVLYNKLNFMTISGNDSYFGNNNNNKSAKKFSKLNSYYSANMEMKNKNFIESLSQEKEKTIKNENINKVDIIQKKIDSLAKNLNLFQYKKKFYNFKNEKNPFKRRLEKIAQRDFIKSYNINNRPGDLSSGSGTSFPSKIMQYSSSYDRTNYTKISKKSNLKLTKNDANLSNSNEFYKMKEINKIDESREFRNTKKKLTEIQNNQEKKIMKNEEISAKIMEAKDEFLYKKIFEFNKINKKRRIVNVIDNKLNIFYSENLLQYNQKINKMNSILARKGKPLMHLGIERNSQKNMDEMIKKVQFIKKIIDYIYPNMVLYKVKQENKKIPRIKNFNPGITRGQLSLSDYRNERRKIDSYFGKSLVIKNYTHNRDGNINALN